MSDTQATMTGRTWRHFSVFWPFMLAGAVGPRGADDHGEELLDGLRVAPSAGALGVLAAADTSSDDGGTDAASASDWQSDAGGDAARPAEVDEPLAAGQELPGPDLVNTARYLQVFGSIPIDDAVLLTFCRAAQLGGALFGDNVARTTTMTEEQIQSMEDAASGLGVDCVQTLYKLTNTTKLHRVVQHLGAELRGRGNLWEGDTSENERLHASCKRMFERSNKRGPGVALQMMRREETQSAIIRELCDADEDVGGGAGRIHSVPSGPGNLSDGASDGSEGEGTDCGGHSARGGPSSHVPRSAGAGASGSSSPPPTHTSQLSFKGRGQRVAIRELRRISALASVANTLRMGDQDCVTQHRTMRIVARFEWGAPTAVQHLRAVKSFFGKPCFYFVRYEDAAGALRWGRMHVILPSLGDERRSCAVVQRMRRATTRPGWVLTRYGCVSLAWEFEEGHSSHPALELVDAVRVLRAEDVQVDWYDLGDRLGLRATPSNKHNSAAERRASRFFTSVFYPWKSREQQPGM